MRDHSPSTHRFAARATHAAALPLRGGRMSLIAIEEEAQLPLRPGAPAARRLRIVRVEQVSTLGDPGATGPDYSPPAADPSYERLLPRAPAEAAERPQTRKQPGYRKILAEPGIRLQLPFGQIRGEMAGQVRHPDKLRDTDMVECLAQVYEATNTMAVASIAIAELGAGADHLHLHPLTQAKARMLVVPELFKPTRYPFETRASTRQIYPGQRVYRLWPAFDPTVEAKTGGRDRVPDRYCNPLQFRYSREEALYDMRGVLGTLPPENGPLARWFLIYPVRLIKSLLTAGSSGRRLKKWRAMLQGKGLDDQLWSVTPPHGFTYHPTVRRWAKEMLARAGYEPERMLLEWEIFWRRKGIV